jgi:hypothetical protein
MDDEERKSRSSSKGAASIRAPLSSSEADAEINKDVELSDGSIVV